MKMKPPLLLLLLVLVLIVSAGGSAMLGRYPVRLADLKGFSGAVSGKEIPMDAHRIRMVKNILMDIRLPRIAAAILIGAALAMSGAVFQSMFVNPLVSPGLLGVLSGSAFGAVCGMIFAGSWLVVQLGAFAFGLVAVGVSIALSLLNRGDRLLMLILGGVISGAMFTALISVVKYLADPFQQLPGIVYWLMGGLSGMDSQTLLLACGPMIGGIAMLWMFSGYLNVLSMGDEEARSMGVNVMLLRFLLIFPVTIVCALTVVMAGVISWVGLIIPHIARMIVGPDNRVLVPASGLIGAIYLLMADNMSRLMFSVEVPIGILTSLAGIPFFAYVMYKTKQGWTS